jgi:hypothetical protein
MDICTASYCCRPAVPASASTGKQQFVELAYDLSFLDARNNISAVSMWLYVASNAGAVGSTVYAFDGSSYGNNSIPCIDPSLCTPLASATLPQSYNWVEIPITNATFLSFASGAKSLQVLLAMPQVSRPREHLL